MMGSWLLLLAGSYLQAVPIGWNVLELWYDGQLAVLAVIDAGVQLPVKGMQVIQASP